jgi:hypothetical protein
MSHRSEDHEGLGGTIEEEVGRIVIRKTVETVVKNAPEEAKAGSVIGGTAMAASGGITLAQAAIAGVAMPAVATIGGFVAVGVVVGGAIGWVGKKLDWF